MERLPSGTVTLLMTDVEGSTRRWEQDPVGTRELIARHDALAAKIVARNHGWLVKERGEGDSLFLVFERATDAARAALELRAEIGAAGLRIRSALHSTEISPTNGDYYGPPVNRCGRLRGTAAGGQILVSESAWALIQAEGNWESYDHGVHRLRDLLRPERIRELSPETVPPPALKSLDARPHNLPLQATPFIGRQSDIDSVSGLVRRHRLVTLTGAGGIGKTRLSLQVSAEVLGEFEEGVCFVELDSAPTLAAVREAVRQALHLESVDGLEQTLGTRPMLLVLDNCEHLSQEISGFVRQLLRGPNLKVLATSREPLRLPSEYEYLVRPLSTPTMAEIDDGADIRAYESVEMFLDRAEARAPRVCLEGEALVWVGRICRRLDGLPLAIELAAPKLRVLSPAQLYDRLSEMMKTLRGGSGDSDRHRTIEATIRWSYDLLSPEERALFHRLSWFAESWTLSSAEAVSADLKIDVFEALSGLVERSLAFTEESAGREARYRFLETIHAFGRERAAEAGDRGPAALFTWALSVTESGDLEQIAAEHNNLASAFFGWEGATADEQLRFTYGFHRHCFVHGYRPLLEQMLVQALGVGSGDPTLLARNRNVYGALLWRLGRLDEARQHIESSLAFWQETGESASVAACLNNLAMIADDGQDYPKAIELFTQAKAVYETRGDDARLSDVLVNLGTLQRRHGSREEARDLLAQALQIKRQRGERYQVADLLGNLGFCLVELGELPRAREALTESATLWSDLDVGGNVILVYCAVARLALHAGDSGVARRLIACASALNRQEGGLKVPLELARIKDELAAKAVSVPTGERVLSTKAGIQLALRTLHEQSIFDVFEQSSKNECNIGYGDT